MKLIIVESPSKAKTIGNFLGKEYIVIASKGHISDLGKFGLGIKLENDKFKFDYTITPDHKQIAKVIADYAKKSDVVYLATDEDREGEAIAYRLVKDVLKGDPEKYPRIAFHEITKSAIMHALENPRKIDKLRVYAQITRRGLDRIVGFKLSSFLNNKYDGKLTAGRVQSCVVQLILDREKEIEAFVPTKYYTFNGLFQFPCEDDLMLLESTLTHYSKDGGANNDKYLVKEKNSSVTIFRDETTANAVEKHLNDMKGTYSVLSVKVLPPKQNKPKEPFITSTLQQYMSSTYGFAPARTMQIAQKLYEGVDMPDGRMGAITYMRTDSLNIAKEAQEAAMTFIDANFGPDYVPKTPNSYTTKSKGAQEAHEAIRPTNIYYTPKIASKYLEKDELKVYTAIYERFLASQSVPATYETTNLEIGNDYAIFKLSGKKTVFDGWFNVAPSLAVEDKPLPKYDFKEGLKTIKEEFVKNSKETEPPARYTEASLIKTMEKEGIGRPSTYASSISLILNREYAKNIDKKLHITDRGRAVCAGLEKVYKEVLDKTYTSRIEEDLDEIAEGKIDWEEYFKKFFVEFEAKIKEAYKSVDGNKTSSVKTGKACPKCGSDLVERMGRKGKFVGCSNYPKCKYIETNFKPKEKVVVGKCPNCNNDIVERTGKRGVFYACSGFPKCKLAVNTKPTETCPVCSSIASPKKNGVTCLNFKCPTNKKDSNG